MLGTRDGVHVGAWASVDDDCSITCLTSDDSAELLFGGPSEPLSIAVSADALETLIATASEALRVLRS